MKIGSRVRQFRKDRRMTNIDLAKLANVSVATISDIENDNRSPTLNTIEQICKALAIPITDILPPETVHPEGFTFDEHEKLMLEYMKFLSKQEKELLISLLQTLLKSREGN